MLGSHISPIEWTLVIIQVARQPLPRVIPEKTCVEVSHCLGLDQDIQSHTLKGLWMVLLPTPMIHLWLALFFNLLPQIGGAYIGFMETWILASTPVWSLLHYHITQTQGGLIGFNHHKSGIPSWACFFGWKSKHLVLQMTSKSGRNQLIRSA